MKIDKRTLPTAEMVLRNVKQRQIISIDNADSILAAELISKISSKENKPKPISYELIKQVNQDTINLVLTTLGLYTFPTIELIEWLRSQIDDDPELVPDAIEICAGTGWIGRNLEIPITDLKLQERDDIKEIYIKSGQLPIYYPDDIEKLDAISAIKKYRPKFVIGSYVTSKYGLSGSDYGHVNGVDNLWVANNCHKYFMIGNLNTHSKDRVMKRKHLELSFPWLITREDSSKSRIFVFENKQWE